MTPGHKLAIAVGGGVLAAIGIAAIIEHKAHAATNPQSKSQSNQQPNPGSGRTIRCPDGKVAPSGIVEECPPPKMGQNDPDAPPGGWDYTGKVGDLASIQAAIAALKAAGDPCSKSAEQAVRNLQWVLGLAQTDATGANAVTPPGTDGRYGGDTYLAASQYDSDMPTPCYSNDNPNNRPDWWGDPGTFTNS